MTRAAHRRTLRINKGFQRLHIIMLRSTNIKRAIQRKAFIRLIPA